jgi:hypothetical protein
VVSAPDSVGGIAYHQFASELLRPRDTLRLVA